VVLLGLGLGALGLFTVGSRGWFGKDSLRVRVGFPEIRGVEVGTRVRIQGIDAGEVVDIEAPARPGEKVILHLRLKGEYRRLVRSDSTVRIVGEGMIGGKVLEIQTGKPDPTKPSEEVADNALLASETSPELTDLLNQVGTTLSGIQKGDGTVGKLLTDPDAYLSLIALLQQSKETMATFQQDAEAVKRLPLVGKYVEDPIALLERPNCQRDRRCFAEQDLFEPGRAVLTAQGRQRLDDVAPWLEGMKHKGSEVVVVAYADPKTATSAQTARALTTQQSEAVCDYLKKQHAIQKMGWFSSRKVTPLGQGTSPPPKPEPTPLPPARVEVQVFVPQG
jgi:phospholipid/cholesterol/gamma-HCH transport system substrate-binding protein